MARNPARLENLTSAKGIFTTGYEQATQAAVGSALRDAGVEVLSDVRYLPLSRRRSRFRLARLAGPR